MSNDKIPVGILGATGSVGQRFVQLLENHPWFEVVALGASKRSAGKSYSEAVDWFLSTPIPERLKGMSIVECVPDWPCRLVFSGLDSSVAGEIEEAFARRGYVVVSNAKNHRMDPAVPLVVPEVNSSHLELVNHQSHGGGCIVTNPNCSTVGLVMALKPLLESFGLDAVHVVTLQAMSGAGFPGLPSLAIHDNVVPFIGGEEEKLETEPLKILGAYDDSSIRPLSLKISAHCNRVPVSDGHLECVSVRFGKETTRDAVKEAWESYAGEPQSLALPLAPLKPLRYFEEPHLPQTKQQRDLDKGMSVCLGRLRECNLFDYKFVLLVHNTIRGAAGGAILNAELMVSKGLL